METLLRYLQVRSFRRGMSGSNTAWLVVGVAVTIFYDRKGLHRMEPRMLEYVHRSAGAYRLETETETEGRPTGDG